MDLNKLAKDAKQMELLVEAMDKEKLEKIFEKFPEVYNTVYHRYVRRGESYWNPIFVLILETNNQSFIRWFLDLKSTKTHLFPKLGNMVVKSNYEYNCPLIIKLYELIYIVNKKQKHESNGRLKEILMILANHISWNDKKKLNYGRKRSIIDEIVETDNLEMAKFLIDELKEMNGTNGIDVKEFVNIFEVNDLRMIENETYRYLQRKRTMFNPKNFREYPQEYQHVFFLFVWIMKQKGKFLPSEMLFSIFDYLDMFSFDYILGDKKVIGEEETIHLWRTLPNFSKNLKSYHHEIMKIKRAGIRTFIDLRGDTGEFEFKGLIEYCLLHRNSIFKYLGNSSTKGITWEFKSKESRNIHHNLIRFVHDLKNEIWYIKETKNEEFDEFLERLEKITEEQKWIQIKQLEEEIQEDNDNDMNRFYRYHDDHIYWLNEKYNTSGYVQKVQNVRGGKDDEKLKMCTLRNSINLFLNFVKVLQ